MAEDAVRRPLTESHFAYEARVDPGGGLRVGNLCASARRLSLRDHGAGARRVGAHDRLEQRVQLAEQCVFESRSDATRVRQRTIHAIGQLERADMAPASLGSCVADDDEISRSIGLDLEPGVGAAPAIARVGAFRDDPLEPECRDLREEPLALTVDVIERAHGAQPGEGVEQKALAVDERQRTEVVVLERQEIEREIARGELDGGAPDLERRREPAPLLQLREARLARRVEHDHLAVDNAIVDWKRLYSASNLWEDTRIVVAVSCEQQHLAARLARQQAVAIELEFEHPSVARERRVGRFGEHDLDGARIHTRTRRGRLLECGTQVSRLGASLPDLLHREARKHRLLGELIARGADPRVTLLDEEPVSFTLLDLHQRPLAVQLVSLELEQELSLFESLAPILQRDPLAAVPDDDAPGTVVPGRNDALEVSVLERMVLDFHGEALVGDVVRRAPRDGPGSEHAVHFDAEVEVELAGRVLVDDEEAARDG